MWLSPHSEKPVGSEVGEQDPRPWISSPVGNQACFVPRLLWDLLLLKTPSPWGSKCLLSIFILPKSELDLPGMEHSPFWPFLLLHCKYLSLMYLVTSSPLLSVKDKHPKQTYEDHLWCKGPRKAIKACQGKGWGPLPLRVAVGSLFLHRISVVHVNLACLIHNSVDTAGWCLHHFVITLKRWDF